MFKHLWIAAVTVLGTAAFACSSGSSSGGGNSCLASQSGSSACTSCVETNCSSELSSVESACSDFINCICANGTYNAANLQTCSPKVTSACNSAETPLGSCETSKCATQCSSSSGSSSGGGSGSSSGSSGGGTTTFSCDLSSSSMVCTSLSIPTSALASEQQACTNQGGKAGTGCPSAGVAGCCKAPSEETCYYSASTAMAVMGSCTGSAGTWSTTP